MYRPVRPIDNGELHQESDNTQDVVENQQSSQRILSEPEHTQYTNIHEEASSEHEDTYGDENHERNTFEHDGTQIVIEDGGKDDSTYQGTDESPAVADELPRPLGTLLKISAIVSMFSIAAAFGFISWLWWTPQNNHGWRKWVLADRLQPSVTLASVIIRTAVGTLAGLVTSMIASAAVERRGIHLHAVAQVSIARASGSGLLSLGVLALRQSRLDAVVRVVIILLILSTTSVQFVSTLLVSDLQQSEIISFSRSMTNAFSFGAGGGWEGTEGDRSRIYTAIGGNTDNYFLRRPHSSETFAEYSEAQIDAEEVDDTGQTVRAFLPLASADTREALFDFKGMAPVTDSRVVCLRPNISDLTICEMESDDPFAKTGICGILQPSRSAAAAVGLNWPWKDDVNFGCFAPMPMRPFNDSHNVWQISQNTTYRGGMNMTAVDWLLYNTTQYVDLKLLWHARWPYDAVMTNYTIYDQSTAEVLNSTSHGPWTNTVFRVARRDGDKGVVTDNERNFTHVNLTITMCARLKLDEDSPTQLDIHASRPPLWRERTSRKEPTYVLKSAKVISQRVRKQLNAVRESASTTHRGRGDGVLIINKERLLSSISEARNGTAWGKYSTKGNYNGFLARILDVPEMTPIILCTFCMPVFQLSYVVPDNLFSQLFLDALTETGSPARALQALYFTVRRSIYYDLMSYYTPDEVDGEAGVAEIVILEPMQVPGRTRGYWAVTGILAVFITTLTVAVWLYRPMRYSLPGNSWHAIAQVSESAELADVLRKAKLATDDEVERLIQSSVESSSSPRNGSAVAYPKGKLLFALRRGIPAFKYLVASGPSGDAPRFVLQDGVFIRAPGDEEVRLELRPKGFRRRLKRKDPGSENLD